MTIFVDDWFIGGWLGTKPRRAADRPSLGMGCSTMATRITWGFIDQRLFTDKLFESMALALAFGSLIFHFSSTVLQGTTNLLKTCLLTAEQLLGLTFFESSCFESLR